MNSRRIGYALAVVAIAGFIGYAVVLGGGHPWGGEEITVATIGSAGYEATTSELLDRSTAYWERNDDRHLDYSVTFDIDTDRPPDAADLVVEFVDAIDECGEHEGRFVGCAPVGPPRETPVTITVERYLEDDRSIATLRHELGHVLGLTHEDEPRHIMGV